ncbi:formate dehydrogenase accessory protein FdhE [Paraburkholderia acidisoli]|uniref:Protein FdhE homolog n=1 Tax=Paraburkholderia acidisoli TaxID=2571748 RepID=A0A7Z2GMH2_9BURK|nr:formate dehydrogenase accessory protein FdhE [Paraburkholderia acidisoli]QGZ64240.1 formate dehydrogenase accessory protein FdhE [Paraburkholderia acidisoli]
MTQRILDPEQIQTLDPSAIPRIRLPERLAFFSTRAARLRRLAEQNPIAGYVRLMAALAESQQQALDALNVPLPSRESIASAQQHSMPILPALSGERDPQWRDVLRDLANRVQAAGAVAPALANVLDALRAMSDAQLESQADAILAQRYAEVAPATAPFIMAALQVVWTSFASRLDLREIPYVDAPGVCPVCGSPPVASVVRVGGAYQGYRYAQCGVCGTENHVVRVKCTNCDSTKGIAYHGIEGGNGALKAESCDECHTYRKIGYQDKDLEIEPLADDLASLTLDLLMGDAGYRRASPNPLLWPEVPEDR